MEIKVKSVKVFINKRITEFYHLIVSMHSAKEMMKRRTMIGLQR
jgi:hypothetical protein